MNVATPGAVTTPLPEYIQIEPVGQCNLRCQMCPIQFRQDGPPHGPPAFMDFDIFTRLINGFAGAKQLHLQGLGEPLLHPRFFDMVRYAVSRGLEVSTNSNMTLMTPEKAEQAIASGLHTLHFSIDGATAAVYDRIRVGARLEQVRENVGNILDARTRLNSEFPYLRLVMVAMRQNLDEIPALVEQAVQWEVASMFVQHLAHDFQEDTLPPHYAPMRDFVEDQTLLNEDSQHVRRVFAHARAIADQHGLALRLPSLEPHQWPAGTPGRVRCSWPWSGAYISYDGTAMPCCMVATPDRAALGSYRRNSVKTVWNGEPYQRFRDALDSSEPPSVCQSCSLYAGHF